MILSEVVIHHKGRFEVALPPSATYRQDCLDFIQAYTETIPGLDIPNLDNIFPELIDVRLLSWEEARERKKILDSWLEFNLGRITMTEVYCHQPIPAEPMDIFSNNWDKPVYLQQEFADVAQW